MIDTDKVTIEWKTLNGVGGREFTDKVTGNSIFLPAAGYRSNTTGALLNVGTHGEYWSSTQDASNNNNAYYMRFGNTV